MIKLSKVFQTQSSKMRPTSVQAMTEKTTQSVDDRSWRRILADSATTWRKVSTSLLTASALVLTSTASFSAPDGQYRSQVREKGNRTAGEDVIQELETMLQSNQLNSYQKALTRRSLGQICLSNEDYKCALEYYEKLLAEGGLSEIAEQEVLFDVAQLYNQEKRYDKVVEILAPWMAKSTNPPPQGYIILGNAYFQLKEYTKALGFVEKAVSIAENPEENWMKLLLGLYYRTKKFKQASILLEELVRRFPNDGFYWTTLSDIYLSRKDVMKAASVLEVAYKKNLLTDSRQFIKLAQLFAEAKEPYKGGLVLEKAMAEAKVRRSARNWELLSSFWLTAQEKDKAAQALEEAVAISQKSVLYFRLGQIYTQQRKWDKAEKSLVKAVERLPRNNLADGHYLLGQAYYEQGKIQFARQSFERSAAVAANPAAAKSWLDFIDSEEKIL